MAHRPQQLPPLPLSSGGESRGPCTTCTDHEVGSRGEGLCTPTATAHAAGVGGAAWCLLLQHSQWENIPGELSPTACKSCGIQPGGHTQASHVATDGTRVGQICYKRTGYTRTASQLYGTSNSLVAQ